MDKLDKQTDAMLQTAIAQRNSALDTIIFLNGQIAKLTETIEELKEKSE